MRAVPWRPLLAGGVVLLVGGLVAGSILLPGLDAQRAAGIDAGVWVLQSARAERYARVNVELGELDTVRDVTRPSGLAQEDDAVLLFADSFARVATVDRTDPADLDDESLAQAGASPAGTQAVEAAGGRVAYLTSSREVFAGSSDDPGSVRLLTRDPAAANAAALSADAIALDDQGVLTAYSAEAAAVLRFDLATSRKLSETPLAGGPTGAGLELTSVGERWLLVAADGRRAWLSGQEQPVDLPTTSAVVAQRPVAEGGAFYLAARDGLVRLSFEGAPTWAYQGGDRSELGLPATPVVFGGEVYAAWLGSSGPGTLWREGVGATPLDYGTGGQLPSEPDPRFMVGHDRMVLNEVKTGWVWRMPGGELVPSSQDWDLADPDELSSDDDGQQARVVTEPKPPVAEPDTFGVRAGELVTLPVLLNDHDPNKDVLTIDPAGLDSLDPAFGRLTLTDAGQRIAVAVADGAPASASFSYRVSDGTAGDGGLLSEPVTVQLKLAGDSTNQAPAFCEDDDCLAQWPEAHLAPGSTLTLPVLNGWVDPEGDPVFLLGATTASPGLSVASLPTGEVVIQHTVTKADQATTTQLSVDVEVADVRGKSATKSLPVVIEPAPKVTAESFALTHRAGEPVTVDIARHTTGPAGTLGLVKATAQNESKVKVSAVGGTTFTLQASAPGSYLVDYQVSDGEAAPVTAQLRFTAVDEGDADFTTAPLTAFVRPNEDATVDVLAAVDNPDGRVLLLDEYDAEPEVATAAGKHAESTLAVNNVGQASLRVMGTTESGGPGRLGVVHYTISDGGDSSAAGELTVYLLPPAEQEAPVAVDDAVTVRAGGQIDVPVTANDVAPSGASVTLDPSSVQASDPGLLAFAAGDVVRLLAPSRPGEYTVDYAAYATGNPTFADDATLTVTVLPEEGNRDPQPWDLTARVLSGGSVEVKLPQWGLDPDGDPVRVERITGQPGRGSAAVAADGLSMVYTGVAGSNGGQLGFGFEVSDGRGGTAQARVRIGVLDREADVTPVTFTDYVQVQAGGSNSIRVAAAGNDLDPLGGTLRLTAVRPNVTAEFEGGVANPEYVRLKKLIKDEPADLADGDVQIAAGDVPGTLSFSYDVVSPAGNTGTGLIVVKVVTQEVPNFPVVSDTTLTAETRDSFASGVDVVSAHTAWTGGDPAGLRLSVWGEDGPAAGVVANGWKLTGELPKLSRTIPFALTATDADSKPLTTGQGTPIVTYGFLHVPGEADLHLALRANVKPVEVKEGESVSFDLADLVAVPKGKVLEVTADGLTDSGARKSAECRLLRGTQVEYRAGEGSPWTDACSVGVRVAGQDEVTVLSVPVKVIPVEPLPVLNPASVTVNPGFDATFDLARMLSPDGETDLSKIDFTMTPDSLRQVELTRKGTVLSFHGDPTGVTGREEKLRIGVAGSKADEVAPATLTVRIGPAPSLLPRGGTVATECAQRGSATSCLVEVIGAAGEVNPFPNDDKLKLDSVHATRECPGVSFGVANGTHVQVSWTKAAGGGTCTASFSVRDARGRVSSGDRDGQLTLDLQGRPGAPDSVDLQSYSKDSVTLRIRPGDAVRASHPEVTGFTVKWGDGGSKDCDEVCTIDTPLGVKRTFEVFSKNPVGESYDSVSVQAWAYEEPPTPTIESVTPVANPDEGGLVSVVLSNIDTARVSKLVLTSENGEKKSVEATSSAMTVQYRIGTNRSSRVTVTPTSDLKAPDGKGTGEGGSTSHSGHGIGAPVGLTVDVGAPNVSSDYARATLEVTASADSGGEGSVTWYGYSLAGAPCTPTGPGRTWTTPEVEAGTVVTVDVCAQARVGEVVFGNAKPASIDFPVVQKPAPPTGYTFTVNPDPHRAGGGFVWLVTADPVDTTPETPPPHNHLVISKDDNKFGVNFTRSFTVRYCHDTWEGKCGDAAQVKPADGSAPSQLEATDVDVKTCRVGQDLELTASLTKDAGGSLSITSAGGDIEYEVYLESGGTEWVKAGTSVPQLAIRVRNISYQVGFAHVAAASDTLTGEYGCSGATKPKPPDPPDDPEDPDPEPGPDPSPTPTP
jgi:hypothetical protein